MRGRTSDSFYPAKETWNPYCWAEELIEWPCEPAPIPDPVLFSRFEGLPLPNIKSRFQLVFIMALPSDATRLETRSFYFYFIYILLHLSFYIYVLCPSIPQTRISANAVTTTTGRKGKKRREKKEPRYPSKTRLFCFYYIFYYISCLGNLLFYSGIDRGNPL